MNGVEQQLGQIDSKPLPVKLLQSLGTSCLQLQASAQGLLVEAGSSTSSGHKNVENSLDAMRKQAVAILSSIDSLRKKISHTRSPNYRPSMAETNPQTPTHQRKPIPLKNIRDHRHSSMQNVLEYHLEETPRNSGLTGSGRRSSFSGIVNRVMRRRDSEMQLEVRTSAPRAPDQQEYPLASEQWFVVDPNGFFRRYWDLLTLFLLAYITVFAPYQIAFLDQYNFSNIKDWLFIFAIDRFTDVFFFSDLILNFRSGWISKSDSSRIEFESGEAARRYLRSWFAVDFVSTLPFDACQTFVSNPASLRLPKLLRLLRLFKLLKASRLPV
jgi:hypothetical protein